MTDESMIVETAQSDHQQERGEAKIGGSGKGREIEQDELFIHSGVAESHATMRLHKPPPKGARSMLRPQDTIGTRPAR